jgi:DNA-binding CsgD family transcriptional regulator
LAAEGGEDAQAALFLEDALALYRELDDPGRTAAVLNSLGVVERQLGDLTRARGLLEESLAIRRELGDAQMVDIALGNLALLAWSQGDLAGAEVMLEETRLVAQQTGDDWSSAIAAAHLGRIAWERRQFGRALDLFAESLTFAQRVGDQGAIAEGLEGLAGALASSGDPAGAARLWGSAEALRETLDLPIPAPERAINDRMVASAVERLDAASFASAWAEGKELPIGQAVEEGLATRDRVASALAPPAAVLSPRQLEIALLIAGGQTNQQIAATLGIAVRTADTHVGAILRKLGVASRAQVRDWVIERGLLAAQDDGH